MADKKSQRPRERIWFNYRLMDENHKKIIEGNHVPYAEGMQLLQDTVAAKITQHDEQVAQEAEAELDPMQGSSNSWWVRAKKFMGKRKR